MRLIRVYFSIIIIIVIEERGVTSEFVGKDTLKR